MKKLSKSKNLLFVFTASILFFSCIANVQEEFEEITDVNTPTEVSFKDAVKPIIDARCTVCHSPNGGTFPNLTTFDAIKLQAERVKVRVGNGTMPQSGALPDAQIKIIVDWVEQGALNN